MTKQSDVDLRAAQIIWNNDCLVLATHDALGPWAAPLTYAAAAPNLFCFTSAVSSRHCQAIAQYPRVAGVVWQLAQGAVVDALQFAGTAFRVPVRDAQDLERKELVWPGLPEGVRSDAQARVTFCVSVDAAYVPDREVWEMSRVDTRRAVDISALFRDSAAHSRGSR